VESAADVADAVKAAMDVADTVDAAMEHVSTAVTAAMSASMSTARGRDGRRESSRDDCGHESNRKRRFSKHGSISSADHPPAAMLPTSAELTLNAASRMRESGAISRCRHPYGRHCQVGVSKIVKTNCPCVEMRSRLAA